MLSELSLLDDLYLVEGLPPLVAYNIPRYFKISNFEAHIPSYKMLGSEYRTNFYHILGPWLPLSRAAR